MSKSTSYWNVLSLTGKREAIEIISSLIQDNSLGCIDTDKKLSMYFDPEKKIEIDTLLSSLNNLHKFDFDWSTQEIEPWHLSWKDNFTSIYVHDKILLVYYMNILRATHPPTNKKPHEVWGLMYL